MITTIGVLKGNVPTAAVGDSSQLEELLSRTAEEAPSGVAVYIPDLGADWVIKIVRR